MHLNGIARRSAEYDGLELVNYGAGHAWLKPAQQPTVNELPGTIAEDATVALADVVEAALYVQLAAYPEPGCRFGICESRADVIVVSETQVPIGIQVELLCGFHADRRDTINTILAVMPLTECSNDAPTARADRCSFEALQSAVRDGRVKVLPHFRTRAAERGFTVDEAREVILHAEADAERWTTYGWEVSAPLPSNPDGQRLHVRVKLTQGHCALLVTGWRASAGAAVAQFAANENRSDRPQHPRWSGEWDRYVFQTPTTYTIVAPNLEAARAWFTDDADPDVDCEPMTFGQPRLLRIVSERAQDAAQQPDWSDRLRPLFDLLRPARRFRKHASVQADMPAGGA